jgi:membrane protein
MMFGDALEKLIAKYLPILSNLTKQLISLRMITALLVLVVFFVLLYGIFPGRRFRTVSQIPGALFATGGWLVFSYAYSYYINHFSNFSYMYGSLTAIILLLLWLYFCMMILLLGAEINLIFPFIKRLFL